MMPTLVIIDMQEDFRAARDPDTVKGVVKAIQTARERKDPILIVWYSDWLHPKRDFYSKCGMLEEVVEAVKGYNLLATVKKKDDDGSKEILRACRRRGFPTDFSICGVNADHCVADSIDGILHRDPTATVKVLLPAVNCECSRRKGAVTEDELHEHFLDHLHMLVGSRCTCERKIA